MNDKFALGTVVKAVTPSDAANLPDGICFALDIGTGGDVAVIDAQDNTYTFKNRADGSTIAHRVKRVLSTGTTATDIGAIY